MPLSRSAARELDRRAIDEFAIPGIVLMENAGRNAAELAARLNPLRLRTAIVCGPGNNGGDGFVIARHLDRLGWPVNLWLFSDPANLTGDAAVNYQIVKRMELPLTLTSSPPSPDVFRGFGWVIDALFGTGLSRTVGPPFDGVIDAINASGTDVLAVDIPSGLDCDSGRPHGPTIRAKATVTFVGMKIGFLRPEAREFVGEVHFVDIGAPRKLVAEYL